MCDELTAKDAEEYLRRNAITRREFGKRGAGAALAMILPPVANAMDVVEQDVMVETPDGMADCFFVHPASGSHAAVIVWPDIVSIFDGVRLDDGQCTFHDGSTPHHLLNGRPDLGGTLHHVNPGLA